MDRTGNGFSPEEKKSRFALGAWGRLSPGLFRKSINLPLLQDLTPRSRHQTGLKFQVPNFKSQTNPKFKSQMT
jgi:hypothetical protein